MLILADLWVAWAASGLVLSYAGSAPRWSAAINLAVAAFWVALLSLCHSYERCAMAFGLEDVRRIVHSGAGLATGLLALTLVTRSEEPSSGLVATATGATLTTLLIHAGHRRWRGRLTQGAGRVRVVVTGHRRDVARVVGELRSSRDHAFDVVAACLPQGAAGVLHDLPVASGFDSLPAAIQEHHAEAVIVVPCRHFDPTTMRRVMWLLEQSHTDVFLVSGLQDVRTSRSTVGHAGALSLLHVRHPSLHGARRRFKALCERLAALVGLSLLMPLMLFLACAIRLESSGPAFYRQVRIGRNGRPFTMIKFRTMSTAVDRSSVTLPLAIHPDSVLHKVRVDPRVTRVGRPLRTYSLDELPQLINVVRGEMSLVGPRPPLPEEVAAYEPDAHRRLVVQPGITGLWQVSGRSDLSWEASLRLDLLYVDNWSLGLDLLILVRTVRAVLGHRGAY